MPLLSLVPASLDVEMQRGFAAPLHITVFGRDSSGASTGPLDLTGATLRLLVFAQIEDTDLLGQAAVDAAVLVKSTDAGSIVLTNAPAGMADAVMAAGDTQDETLFPQGLGQPWDLRILQPSLGSEYRMLAGTWTVS